MEGRTARDRDRVDCMVLCDRVPGAGQLLRTVANPERWSLTLPGGRGEDGHTTK